MTIRDESEKFVIDGGTFVVSLCMVVNVYETRRMGCMNDRELVELV